MSPVTGEQVKAAMIGAGVDRVEHHACSLCRYETAYVRHDDRLYFDSGCDCTRGRNEQPRSWESAAEWINMQSHEDVRARLKADFGFPSGAS